MILTREIEILITKKNIEYFENNGYNPYLGENLIIPIEILQASSNKKILCKCDKCGKEKQVIFKNLNRYKTDNFNDYLCRKCSDKTRLNTLSKIYDFDIEIKDGEKELFKEYKERCKIITSAIRGVLFSNWNGYDYYDGEYIKDNFKYDHRNKLYPTIDHKISILYGFKNNIPLSEINHISNLCITKLGLNAKKKHLNGDQFLKILKS